MQGWSPLAGGRAKVTLSTCGKKAVSKTAELVAWGRLNNVSVDVLERLWRLHVESSVLFGYAIHWLPVSGQVDVDRVQRKCGRMILGFSRRSPTPTVFMELGWGWSARVNVARAQLLRRLVDSDNAIVQLVVRASRSAANG